MNKKIILASNSIRRKELLEMANIDFEIIPAVGAEVIDRSIDLEKAICQVARNKALEVFLKHQDSVVIGADTIVTIDGNILQKPKDDHDAYLMLKKLSGQTHQVITGVSIISKEKEFNFASVSNVKFFDLTDQEINDYILTKEPRDKAGAYGIQGLGSLLVEKIDGDFYSIVGLPLAQVVKILKKL